MSSESNSDLGPLDPAMRRVGTVLDGKWKLERVLGVGGMAAVYAATHRNGAQAAIKLFPFSVTTSPESAERILREGYLANKIGHPAIVRVLDDHLDREREFAYLVMELLDGETARQRVERLGPMSPLEAVTHLIDLADCLGAAHGKGVVHRDIKPENLFITKEGKLKVLDFGVARALDGTSSVVTRTGAALGTPAYMSPEQARGKPSEISPRTDIYSAGATLLFLVAGEFLHDGESAQEIMVRAAWTPARKIKDRGLGLPDSVSRIIDKASEFEPRDRYQSAAELKAALEEARAELAANPQAAVPAVRTVRLSDAPTVTLPGPPSRLRGRDETIADATPPPADGPTIRSGPSARRATLFVGGSLTLAIALGLLALWPRARGPEVPSPPESRAAVQPAAAAATPGAAPGPSAMPAPAAPSAEATAPPPPSPPVPSAPLARQKRPPVHQAAPTMPRRAAATADLAATAAAPAPTPKSPHPASPATHSTSMGRDIGY